MYDNNDSKRKWLDDEWKGFARTVDALSKRVAALTYDAMPSPPMKLGDRAIDDSDRYFLPEPYPWPDVEQLFTPLPMPKLPQIPAAPALQLPSSQYASSYLEPRKKGELSFLEKDLERRRGRLRRAEKLRAQIERKREIFEDILAKETIKLQKLRQEVLAENPEALVTSIELADKRHWLPAGLRGEFKALAEPEAKVVLIELRFPDYSNHRFVVGKLTNRTSKYASVTENKKMTRRTLYSVVIRAGYIASRVLEGTTYQTVAVNVVQDWFDRATGAARSGVICSLQAQVEEFTGLNLRQVDPEACFKYLKGISAPSLETLSPIRPIFVLNKKDERFVEAKDLSEFLETEENLAAMPWDDFEHLVAQLFEWEFAKDGVEVRVTRVSRDRGVDAILFDPDPLRGGKFVLQAKRYTKPVDVAAVRDLYGTVMNEGANRGILITTSSYGPDAYEFVKNKPLSLVDGPNLLLMLQRHGKKFRLDLAEARRLLREMDQ